MNLQNGNIKLKEILANKSAKQIIFEEFPQYKGSPLLLMGQNLTLKQVLAMNKGKVSKEKVDKILERLNKV